MCKEAKADLAFLVDGSWSIGDDNFMKITRFLYSTMGSLDLIGPDGTQVSINVAYVIFTSDKTNWPKTLREGLYLYVSHGLAITNPLSIG